MTYDPLHGRDPF